MAALHGTLDQPLEEATGATRRVAAEQGETFAITDWGRGRRAAQRLLDGLGARTD